VPRVKHEHVATALDGLRAQKRVRRRRRVRRGPGQDCRIVVREDERVLVGRVLCAARARVSRAEVARQVVARRRGHGRRFSLALPGALGAVRRDEDVLARERVNASVRVCGGVKRLCHRTLWHRGIEGGKDGVHVDMTSIDIRSRASRVKGARVYEADGARPMSAHVSPC
jgi:hypothetical protein